MEMIRRVLAGHHDSFDAGLGLAVVGLAYLGLQHIVPQREHMALVVISLVGAFIVLQLGGFRLFARLLPNAIRARDKVAYRWKEPRSRSYGIVHGIVEEVFRGPVPANYQDDFFGGPGETIPLMRIRSDAVDGERVVPLAFVMRILR